MGYNILRVIYGFLMVSFILFFKEKYIFYIFLYNKDYILEICNYN